MYRTNNLNIKSITEVIAPSELKQVFPLSEQSAAFVTKARNDVRSILHNRDQRLMIVVGPCSIHDPVAALDYARRLSKLSRELDDQLLIVMRVYFEKPRTTVGWKGLINDPDLDGTHLISKGLGIARQLFCAITELELPIATEMLDTITPEYFADLISWGDGNLQIAMDAMSAAKHGHSFLGINRQGRISIVETCGNPDAHIVLRGGSNGPNYQPEAIACTESKLADQSLNSAIMVDCSHANSCKDHNRQEEVVLNVLEQIANGNNTIRALMIESNLEEGNQSIGPCESLKYGVSITDKCINWETTDRLLRMIHSSLKDNNGRTV